MSENPVRIETFEQFMTAGPREDLTWKDPQESWRAYMLFRPGFDEIEIDVEDVIALAVKRGCGGDYPDIHYVFSAKTQSLHRIPFNPNLDLVTWKPVEGAPAASF
jgi:hypothetical protein